MSTIETYHSSTPGGIVLSAEHSPPVAENGDPYKQYGEIFVAPHLTEQDLVGFDLDPIVDRSIRGLGRVSLEAVRRTDGGQKNQPTRTHRLYTAELNDYRHAFEATDPAEHEAE